MPKIVIERYQTGRYATNSATDASYLKALQVTGSVPAPGAPGSQQTATNAHSLSADKLQAVGQAVAGQNYGGAVVKAGSKAGTGAKDAPLYVVVEESWGATALKWVKMFLWAGIAGYFLLVILTMVVELTGSFRTRANQNNEVQPQHQTVRFNDVHGCDEAKDELQEVVEFLLNPEKFNQLGGKIAEGAFSSLVHLVLARLCLLEPSQAKQVVRSSTCLGPSSTSSTWVWAQNVCEICLLRLATSRLLSYSSTSSTQSEASVMHGIQPTPSRP